MSDDERDELIKIVQSFTDFVDQYRRDEDRKETARIEEREHTNRWRNGFKEDLLKIDERLKPIERDHLFVMKTLKWGGGLAATGAALMKLWDSLKDRLG